MLRYQTTTGRRAPLPAGTTVAWPEASGLAAMHERRVTRGTDHVDGPDGARLEVAQAKVSQPVGLRVRPGLHGRDRNRPGDEGGAGPVRRPRFQDHHHRGNDATATRPGASTAPSPWSPGRRWRSASPA